MRVLLGLKAAEVTQSPCPVSETRSSTVLIVRLTGVWSVAGPAASLEVASTMSGGFSTKTSWVVHGMIRTGSKATKTTAMTAARAILPFIKRPDGFGTGERTARCASRTAVLKAGKSCFSPP